MVGEIALRLTEDFIKDLTVGKLKYTENNSVKRLRTNKKYLRLID
jgi:hypothetical protein